MLVVVGIGIIVWGVMVVLTLVVVGIVGIGVGVVWWMLQCWRSR